MEEEGGVSGVAVGVVDRQGWEREKGGGKRDRGRGREEGKEWGSTDLRQ